MRDEHLCVSYIRAVCLDALCGVARCGVYRVCLCILVVGRLRFVVGRNFLLQRAVYGVGYWRAV